MNEKIINSILRILKENYKNIPRAVEKVEQGFKEPLFFIKSIKPSQEKKGDVRYNRVYEYDIRYFSNSNEDKISVAENLFILLEYIKLEDESLLRAKELSYNIEDDETLHFFAKYDVMLIKQKEKVPTIDEMDLKEGIKSE